MSNKVITLSHLYALTFLACSSCFMVVAWYGHLRFATLPIWKVVLGSWLIAFMEYCFQVPGNRLGHTVMSAAQLRIVAEFFTMVAFFAFSFFYLKEPLKLNIVVAFTLMFAGVCVAFWGPFKN